jgi:purine-binding chemotaxis protein CheW
VSKSGFASEKVMRSYLNALLIDEEPDTATPPQAKRAVAAKSEMVKAHQEPELRPVAKLLEKVNVLEQPVKPQVEHQAKVQTKAKVAAPAPQAKVTAQIDVTTNNAVAMAAKRKAEPAKAQEKLYRQGDFQALFFDVAGLTVAVPLTELGGIHNMGKLNSLIGKPDWFMGVMVHREHKLSIVNTAKWVMPEKYDIDLENSIEYQYIIMLDNSPWGLACEKLVNTVTLQQDDVKWKEHSGRRPWLAGLIKERMCALLDVSALIEMLEQGQSTLDDVLNNQSMVDESPL